MYYIIRNVNQHFQTFDFLPSTAETLSIMALDRDPADSVEFYTTFTGHIWNVFHIVCRDLGELRHLVRSRGTVYLSYT